MATQAERRATTRSVIVAAARELFLECGYDGSSVADILERAGVSRGAMYHHFSSKQAVFEAVFLETSADAIRQSARRATPEATPLETLISGCLGWLDVSAEPDVARMLFVEGPRALGWERCRTLEEATSLGVMRRGIAEAVASGEIEAPSVDLTARLLNAVLAEAALTLRSAGNAIAKRDVEATVTSLIRGLATG